MANINQRQGRYLMITRRMREFFREIPEWLAWAESVNAKVDNSSATLSDVEQRSGIPALSRVHELGKDLENDRRGRRMHSRLMELEKEVAELKKLIRPQRNTQHLDHQLADIAKSYRPR